MELMKNVELADCKNLCGNEKGKRHQVLLHLICCGHHSPAATKCHSFNILHDQKKRSPSRSFQASLTSFPISRSAFPDIQTGKSVYPTRSLDSPWCDCCSLLKFRIVNVVFIFNASLKAFAPWVRIWLSFKWLRLFFESCEFCLLSSFSSLSRFSDVNVVFFFNAPLTTFVPSSPISLSDSQQSMNSLSYITYFNTIYYSDSRLSTLCSPSMPLRVLFLLLLLSYSLSRM